MRTKIYALLCLAVLIIFMLSIIPIYAETTGNKSVGIALTEEDANKIVDYYLSLDDKKIKAGHSDLYINQGYYLYSLHVYENNIVDEVKNGSNIKDIISDNYRMVVPTDGGYIEFVKDENGKISYFGSAEFIVPMKDTGLVDISVIDNILSSEKYLDVDDVIVFNANMYITSFVYFSLNDVEYLIPFSGRPDLTGLENGKVYKASDCISTLSKTMPRDNMNPNVNGESPGTYSESKDDYIIPITFSVVLGSCMLFAAIVIFAVRRRKRLEK